VVHRGGALITHRVRSLILIVLALALPAGADAAPRGKGVIELSHRCSESNYCDRAFAGMRPGGRYHLRAGTWKFTRPIHVPSHVTFTGDGTSVLGTDLVYAGPKTNGAIMVAGAHGKNWAGGHIGGFEIETSQLHGFRLGDESQFARVPITQAAVGLRIIRPTGTSTVTNVNVWKFGRSSVEIVNRAARPGRGFFQFSDFFIGTSPRPLVVRGSRARLLIRFGGIDLGPLSRLGMLVRGSRRGSGAVVQSVKVEGDYDVPGYVVEGRAPVVFVGTTRYLNRSLYVTNPANRAPAFVSRGSGGRRFALQCLGCTVLGQSTALAVPGLDRLVPADTFGTSLDRLTPRGRRVAARALATPEVMLPRPRAAINLARGCRGRNCDAALARMKFGRRYYLPAGTWRFSRPFTIPETATLFGDGRRRDGGTTLRYVGRSIPGDAAVLFGAGETDMAGRFFSLRVETRRRLASGYGIRARDATNASTLQDLAVAGFPDGQLLLDATPNDRGSGPNFVRISGFSLVGGTYPLRVKGGRQTVLIDQGRIQLGKHSKAGIRLTDGEQLAATRVISDVVVHGRRSAPGFRIRGPAVTVFAGAGRRAGRPLRSPAILYTALVPRRVTQCLGCWIGQRGVGFSMPQLGVGISPRPFARFRHLNQNTALRPPP